MTYWIIFTNEDNWKNIQKNKIWGTSEKYKNVIGRVEIGDLFLIYVKPERYAPGGSSKIVAEYKATSKLYKDKSKVFSANKPNELYPYRINLSPVKIFKTPIPFKELVPKLTFIFNKKSWGLHVFGRAMRNIPENDFKLIMASAK